MLIREGAKGIEVSSVQKLLSLLGYDLIIDGDFGSRTTRSVRSFQKKYNLSIDGIVGDRTYQTLKAAQKRNSKESGVSSDKNYGELDIVQRPLASGQFIKQKFTKKQIYLHFTAGGPIAKNVIDGWNSDEPRIATAYAIDGNDGSIYECFNPSFWSYHLGVKGTRGKLDKSSIGIEICNWGPLDEKDGKYYGWPAKEYNKYIDRYEVKSENVVFLDTPHRGYTHYQKITDEQIESVEKLLIYLIKEFDIPVNDNFGSEWSEFQEHVIKGLTPGIWNHVNVRKDKFDLCPDKRITSMLNGLKGKL
jgi:N-acetyl-anhydromuramyl-L-alanine amidase AmpD